eukprot:CAMPEP_0119494784 /NCGR_PEP_ID=MMETSP1344-20130328/18625_1 /TAXON_ID=236787 /ORGANISM="Florenciella parvula, Strain CCMP2471" /LENGTH=49 /DNA_ID= /DNA_START= /DNA_END= /DNA_ORIENTATION=
MSAHLTHSSLTRSYRSIDADLLVSTTDALVHPPLTYKLPLNSTLAWAVR